MTTFSKIFDPSKIDLHQLAFTGVTVLLTLLGAFILYRVMVKSMTTFEAFLEDSKMKSHRPAQAQRVKTVVGMIRQLCTVCLAVLTGVLVLDELGVDIRPILAGAGVVGLAVGFGAQSLVKDFFTGLCLILENQVTIGDWVEINGKSGAVEVLNFRITALRDVDGTLHIIPNGTITTISNSTHGYSAIVLDLAVPRELTFEKATAQFKQVYREMKADDAWNAKLHNEDLEVMGVQDYTDRGMVIRLRMNTDPGAQWAAGREYRGRLKALGWDIPTPIQSLKFLNREPSLSA